MVEEEKNPVDIGFRVLKVDSTNMKDVYYSPNLYNQRMLEGLESNIKEGRTDFFYMECFLIGAYNYPSAIKLSK